MRHTRRHRAVAVHQNPGMPLVPLDPRTTMFLLAVVYLLMSGLVWMILRRYYDGVSISLWCAGGGFIGANYFLFSVRTTGGPSWTVLLPTALNLLGLGLRLCALYRERGQPERWRHVMLLCALAIAASLLASPGGAVLRRPVNGLLILAAATWLTVLAYDVGRRPGGRGPRLIGGSDAFFSATMVLRMAEVLSAGSGASAYVPTLDLLLVLLGGLVAGIFGNVGYVDLALEAARARREAQARDLRQEQMQRGAAEAQAKALAERLAERDEFVRVLAHEVRQPLNNASAALQGASAALQPGALEARSEAEARLQRAQKVIGHIVGAIDNTLAATTVLASTQPLAPRDADVNMLIELSLGDLEPALRARVVRERSAHARTVAMDIGLMRLALRNLLANALTYSTPDKLVTLQVSDSDEPLGLAFEVRDLGGGLPGAVREHLFERGARGDHGLPGHGLGLYVVRQIMLRHGGQVGWAPNQPQGSVFRLWLPLGD